MPTGIYDHKKTKGNSHWNWKGDSVGYFGVHNWMTKNYGKPQQCEECGITEPPSSI